MAEVKLYVVQGDGAPDWQFTVKRDGVVVNLTTASKVELKIHSTVTGLITNVVDDCVVTDAANGVVTYDLKAADIAEPGVYLGDLVITWSATQPETDPDYVVIYVRPKAGTVS